MSAEIAVPKNKSDRFAKKLIPSNHVVMYNHVLGEWYEYIELFNDGDQDVDISQWVVQGSFVCQPKQTSKYQNASYRIKRRCLGAGSFKFAPNTPLFPKKDYLVVVSNTSAFNR
jgi:hypothetical protein